MASDGVPDKHGTRPAILAVAQELFAAHGYAGTSVADIADRLGMSKAALGTSELLGAVIDITADLYALADVIGNDPSARSALQDVLPRSQRINETLTSALAGPRPDPARVIRAHAAYAAAKNGTLALLAARGGHLSPQDRAELLAAAERALTQ
jgi:AcrR family transcriptional regulator